MAPQDLLVVEHRGDLIFSPISVDWIGPQVTVSDEDSNRYLLYLLDWNQLSVLYFSQVQ